MDDHICGFAMHRRMTHRASDTVSGDAVLVMLSSMPWTEDILSRLTNSSGASAQEQTRSR